MAEDSADLELLKAHIDRVRSGGVLSRSEVLRRLFDFLAERTLLGKSPKEIEIAIDVFGKDASFAVVQDAVVRVNIHKLRRKLDEHYAAAGDQEASRLLIPRGEYRLALASRSVLPVIALSPQDAVDEPDSPLPAAPGNARSRRPRWWVPAVVATILLANATLWIAFRPALSPSMRDLAEVRANPIWRDMNDDDLPIYVAIGDYYIFGELDDTSMNLRRLAREFNINSRTDLEQFLKNNPDLAGRYMDVSLQYLPISAGYALHNLLPLLQAKSSMQVQVIQASELTPAMLKSAHVVYIGLLSGLGMLRELALAGSQFQIGDSYDELIDRKTGKHYVSQASSVVESRNSYRDYGYFSTVVGASGNRIVIVSGTRDVAVIHVAESVAHSQSLARLVKQAGRSANFEALYTVEAIDRTNLDGQVLFTGKLAPPTWD